jgi:hypothetical protein
MNLFSRVINTLNEYFIFSTTATYLKKTNQSNYSPHSLFTNPINPPLKSSQIIALSIFAIVSYTCLTQIRNHQKLGRLNKCIATAAAA